MWQGLGQLARRLLLNSCFVPPHALAGPARGVTACCSTPTNSTVGCRTFRYGKTWDQVAHAFNRGVDTCAPLPASIKAPTI